MKTLLLIILIFSCMSCGTIGVRSSSKNYGELYPATKLDFHSFDSLYSESNWLFPPFLIAPFIIIDVPISLITDTIFLPVDLIVMTTKNNEE